jgi:hypothetical protein
MKLYEVQVSSERLNRLNSDFLVVQLIGGYMVGLMLSNLNIALERDDTAKFEHLTRYRERYRYRISFLQMLVCINRKSHVTLHSHVISAQGSSLQRGFHRP